MDKLIFSVENLAITSESKTDMPSFYRYFPISRRDEKWGLYATTAGESRITPGTLYPPNGHPKGYAFDWQEGRVLDEYHFIYISSGRGKFESKPNFSIEIEPGHAILLFPGAWHRYTPAAETGWHEHWIGFDGDIARSWQRQHFLSPKNPVLKINAEDTILATFSRIIQTVRASRPALQQILAGATANLLGLFYSAQQTRLVSDEKNNDIIEVAIARIQNDYAGNLDIASLARELGVSYGWFRKKFSEHSGLSPHQYLLELRIIRARSLLAETRLPIKEIAAQTGFQDEHYFSRLFHKKLNLTPTEWRNRSRRRK